MSAAEEDMKPVVETQEALDLLTSYSRDGHLATSISRMAQRVRSIVPECVALSLGLMDEGLTFTLVSETRDAALLDAMQYIDGGPCVAALQDGEAAAAVHEATDEGRWQLHARGQGLAGVASTLSLPVMDSDRVVCGINLYASTPSAFDGHHEELADACGAWAMGAVTNADLSFTSRLRAAAAPARLREDVVIDAAIGFVAGHLQIDTRTAAGRIRQAAALAGVREADVAKFILDSNPAWSAKNSAQGA